MSQSSKSIDEVLQDEIVIIGKRRAVHDAPSPMNPHESDVDQPNNVEGLTGLALSGGGVRSAAFSLGFIQGMCRSGRMKAFDFLSTVSGGGYAGALFSSEIAQKKGMEIDWRSEDTRQQDTEFGSRLDIEAKQDGGQSDRVRMLGMHGKMMANFVRLFSRHLWGLIINFAFALSGIVAIAGVLAYVMRFPWDKDYLPYLQELRFLTDLSKPFFFATIAFFIWLFSHFATRLAKTFNRRLPPVTQYSYLLLLATLLLGLISLLSIGDADVDTMIRRWKLSPTAHDIANQITGWVTIGLGGTLVATLAPYISPKRLMRSGQNGSSAIQTTVFNVAGKALLFGAPLAIFYFMVHEDISNVTGSRPNADQMDSVHIRLPEIFIPKLESDAIDDQGTQSTVAKRLSASIHGVPYSDDFNSSALKSTFADKWLALERDKERDELEIGVFRAWMQCLASPIDDAFSKRVDRILEIRKLKESAARRITERCLSDPYLFAVADTKGAYTKDADTKLAFAWQADLNDKQADLSDKNTFEPRLRAAVTVLKDFRLGPYDESNDGELTKAVAELKTACLEVEKKFWEVQVDSKARGVSRANLRAVIAHLAQDRVGSRGNDHQVSNGVLLTALKHAVHRSDLIDKYQQIVQKAAVEDEVARRGELEPKDNALVARIKSSFSQWWNPATPETQTESTEAVAIHLSELEQEELRKEIERAAEEIDRLTATVRISNWKVLHALYPQHVQRQDTVFAYIANRADQRTRLKVISVAAGIFLLIGFFINMNSTSLHGVYRDQLSEMWLADPSLNAQDLDSCSSGGPYHLINCTINRMGHRTDPDAEGKSRFLISQKYCGTKKLGYRETSLYQHGKTKVADAVAISGAAITTINAPSFLHRLILFLTNFRLGQWLPNPQNYRPDFYWPSPIRCFANLLWYPGQRSHLFVSDGGHLENSGLGALLERRCEFMVCVDAGHDPDYKFSDLLKLVHGARSKYGITTEILDHEGDRQDVTRWLSPLVPDIQNHLSDSHFVIAKIKYPDVDKPAYLIFCKLTVTHHEPLELVRMAQAEDQSFPHDPTSNQFLPPETFDAYLTLGRCVADELNEYVDNGNLANICPDLPLGWSRPRDQADKKHDAQDSPGSQVRVKHHKHLQAELEHHSFDKAGIAFAISAINAAFEDSSIDEFVPATVFVWAKETALNASAEMRAEFCKPFKELVKANMKRPDWTQEVSEECGQILLHLEGRTSFAIKLISGASLQTQADPN